MAEGIGAATAAMAPSECGTGSFGALGLCPECKSSSPHLFTVVEPLIFDYHVFKKSRSCRHGQARTPREQ